ncbi:hypothetical protein K503DRAFT_767290 [Rhizopogon vinicolor AM-OR11-026]|uniref:Uncharacterized protein n=1 Tax=Rhizopogon vinicolor AM-OR11-026 TaxID=1314800 RepID=A0A1B7NAI7_9AGAM|nr:hypothetical protein K503DRAFT_767290 [Rhizopogon vinicolor AM-OR11-026]
MARPLVLCGPSSGSLWPILWSPLVISLEFLILFWFLVPPLVACSLLSNSYYPICPLLSFSFTPSFLVVVYTSSRTCILIL